MAQSKMSREEVSNINVLVVGAGLAGLYAAIELYRQGHSVKVVESKPGVEQAGDFVGIGRSATKQFTKWPGMSETYSSIIYQPVMNMYAHDGTFLCGGFRLSEESDYRPVPVSRPKLIQALYDYVISLGIPVEFGKRVIDYYESQQTNLAYALTDDGECFAADVVVAADGIGTKAGRVVGGKESKAISSGYSVYRVAFPTEVLFQDPFLKEQYQLKPGQPDHCDVYVGPGVNVIILISPEITTWLFTHEDKGQAAENWSTKLDASEVMVTLKNSALPWDEKVKSVIERTPPGSIIDYKISWRDPDPDWTSPGGRIVKIGDAAHAFIPNSTNGATQAMEDGQSLAACLRLATKNNVPLAIRIHTKLRFERTSCAQRNGFRNRDKWDTEDFEALKENPEAAAKSVGRWLYTHDAEHYVYQNWHACMNHLLAGTVFKNSNIPPGYDYKPWTMEQLMAQDEEGVKDAGDWD